MTKQDAEEGKSAAALAEAAPSVDAEETRRFGAMADSWWDPCGPFRPLHRLNLVRVDMIRDGVCGHFGCDATADKPLTGLSVLDIGCGGGLACEPLTRLGARVVGIDPSAANIDAARAHAEAMGLAIDYYAEAPETFAERGETFDVALALEVVEHVKDLDAFLAAMARLVVPSGAAFAATINRTLRAWALAIVAAERVLRWLPKGTHEWRRFITPQELDTALAKAGFETMEARGVAYHPLFDEWRPTRSLAINYMARAARRGD